MKMIEVNEIDGQRERDREMDENHIPERVLTALT